MRTYGGKLEKKNPASYIRVFTILLLASISNENILRLCEGLKIKAANILQLSRGISSDT